MYIENIATCSLKSGHNNSPKPLTYIYYNITYHQIPRKHKLFDCIYWRWTENNTICFCMINSRNTYKKCKLYLYKY